MGKKYLLPPLLEESEIKSDNCWEDFENPYDFLVKKMKLQNEPNTSIFEGGSNAVPHVFEQMILFHDAFLDEKHPEHERAVIEWRAILILLALQRIQNIDISLKKVEFNEQSENPFLRAAAMFIPEDIPVFFETTWDFLYIICLKDKPIAFVSPITLVCPSKQFMKKIVDWMDKPIITLEKVNNKDKMFLNVNNKGLIYANIRMWLKSLKSRLTCSMPQNSEVYRKAQKVEAELMQFIKKCEENVVGKDEVIFKENIYPVLNNTIRQEYGFLNFCCDFIIKNKKLEFLVERYREDIFENNIALLVKDKMPDTMEQTENIKLLESIFPNVLKLNGKSVIFLEKYSGERMAACVLLPFKTEFVKELIEQNVVAEEFFEKFSAVYDANKKTIQISLQISEFPYAFEKIYSKEKWKYMFLDEIPPIYSWPKGQIRQPKWNMYYTYIEGDKPVKVSVPMSTGNAEYKDLTNSSEKNLFKLARTANYACYLQLRNTEVGGYLPIKTSYEGMNSIGKTLEIFIDIGHTTTYMHMVKRISENEYENIPFRIPNSLKIADNGQEVNHVDGNFLSADENQNRRRKTYYIKNMLHSFQNYEIREDNPSGLRPFSTGQILFDAKAYCDNKNDTQISFFNFEYCNSDEAERKNIHTFIEQLLLYAAHQANISDCSYLKIHFLHDMKENNTCYGEIYALWENVLEWVKKWSGINSEYDIDIDSLPEYKALTYNTYLNAVKQESMEDKTMYVGIDMGWKKTLITYFDGMDLSNQDSLEVCHARIKYAGCDISLMKEDVLAVQEFFTIYADLLSILLIGSTDYKKNDKFCKILEKFEKYCKGQDTGHHAYYQGVFDLIAILIEEEMPNTDMYNNMQEYRKFIGMLTYNLFLVFLNIGCLLGKTNKKTQKVYLYLGGNGAKFIHWISNCKKATCIDKENCHSIFLLNLEQSMLDIIKKGFEITGDKENLPEEICIVLSDCGKEQLIRGYMFKESYDLQKQKGNQTDASMYNPNFKYTEVENIFEGEIQKNKFDDITDKMCEDIFEEKQKDENTEKAVDTSLRIVQTNGYTLNIDELITEKSKNVCREIIKKIYKMQSIQEE